MYLVSLVYASIKSPDWCDDDIYEILTHAEAYNSQSGITGVLCFNGETFLQCLEGSRSVINALYRKIQNDKRHDHVMLLDYKEISERSFTEWNMLYIPVSSAEDDTTLRQPDNTAFDPFRLRGASALSLCRELASHV